MEVMDMIVDNFRAVGFFPPKVTKIEVTYEPSEHKAHYFYASTGNGGQILEYGAQFDPFGAPEREAEDGSTE